MKPLYRNTLYGDGYQVRDLLYIDDLVRAYNLALHKIEKVTAHQKIFVSDIHKASKLLGWTLRVTVHQGLKNLCLWATQNRHLFS